MNPIQTQLDRYWNQRARSYHADQMAQQREDIEHEIWVSYMRRVLPDPPGRALDVGTGTGYIAMLIDELGWDTVGIDTSPGMLDCAPSVDGGPRFARGDAVEDCGNFGTFDLVINRYLMWTLAEPLEAVRRWRDVLRPGGQIVIIDAHHFPAGLETIEKNSSGEGTSAFSTFYNRDVVSHLPLALARSVDEYTAVFKEAGFGNVTVTPVPEIVDMWKEIGVPQGHDLVEPFIIVAS